MPRFRMQITKDVNASYEFTADTNDVALAQQLEEEKLRFGGDHCRRPVKRRGILRL